MTQKGELDLASWHVYRKVISYQGIRVVLVLFRRKNILHKTNHKEGCQGTQPYLFEPYDSEASSVTDSTIESDEEQHTQSGKRSMYFLWRVLFTTRTFVT